MDIRDDNEATIWQSVLIESLKHQSVEGAIRDADIAVGAWRQRTVFTPPEPEPEPAPEELCPGYESATIGMGFCKHCAMLPGQH